MWGLRLPVPVWEPLPSSLSQYEASEPTTSSGPEELVTQFVLILPPALAFSVYETD